MRHLTIFRAITAMLIWAGLAFSAFAGEPPSEPQLRLDSGTHQAIIQRISVDAANRFLVTGSNDKTARLWELATGKLLQTFRLPIGAGNEGKLYAVALSPDGQTVAVGGVTGAAWDQPHSIYLFDRASGRMLRRLTGLPQVINHLAYALDGQRLVATLGANGIRVWRTSDWQLVGEDRDYGDASYGAAFDQAGRLVTTSYDGFVRLYDAELRLLAKQRPPDGAQPYGVAFSPDGTQVAVGLKKAPKVKVAILSGQDLSFLYAPVTPDMAEHIHLSSVAWSVDGQRLYAAGSYYVLTAGTVVIDSTRGTRVIRVWGEAGRGTAYDLPVETSYGITALVSLRDRGVAYGTGDPSWGIFDPQGRRTVVQGHIRADFRGSFKGTWGVSADGTTIAYGYEYGGTAPAQFSVASRAVTVGTASGATALSLPRTSAPGLTVTDWHSTITPKLNGQPLKLDQHEISRSVAVDAEGQRVLLGTEWYIRLFDRAGRELWQVPVPGTAWGVNLAGNGQVAVAALGDGTIRWYRLRDGQELLAFFPHADRKRWVLWTPKGYFDASEGASDLIGWHVNQDKDKEALFYPASQFFEQFYRPDLIAEVIKNVETDEQVLARLGEKERANMQARFKKPPTVAIVSPKAGESFDKDEVEVQVRADDQGGGVDEIRLYHNGKVVGTETRGVAVSAGASAGTPKVFRVRLVDGANSFRAVAFSTDRIESNPDELTIQLKATGKAATLHLLLVGINEYKNPALNLNYALPDAQGVQKFFAGSSTLFKEIKRHELYDKAATKTAILAKLQELQASAPQDVVLIYLAGHGDSLENVWYFVPYDLTMPEREETMKTQGLSSAELKEHLGKIGAQKVLVLMDACKSGAAMVAFAGRGVEDRKAMAQLARSTGTHVVAASTKDQLAAEVKDLGHGVFTYTLLEGLSGKADGSPKDGAVTVRELLSYVETRLPEISEKYKQQAQYPVVDSRGQDFPLATVK